MRETAAPEGYSRMEDYLLHVDESWKSPDPIRLVNIPSTYLFYKCENRRNPLAGVPFAVKDEHGSVVQEVMSAENGAVTIEGLTPGSTPSGKPSRWKASLSAATPSRWSLTKITPCPRNSSNL